MRHFITAAAYVRQLPKRGKYQLCNNELFNDNGFIYLAWRNFVTDNFTWIISSDWDIRCSHGHDVGCEYHQVVRVKLSEQELWDKGYLINTPKGVFCKDIPTEYLEVVNVSKWWINNLFYRMLKNADNPKTPWYIQILYRIGVAFNFNWYFTGKTKIDLNSLYKVYNI